MTQFTSARCRHGAALLVSSALIAGACGDGPTEVRECGGDVAIMVTAGTTPEFSWTPACGALAVRIEEIGDPAVPFGFMWELIGAASPIQPPVRYGVLPGGSVQVAPATPLVSGSTYRVDVYRFEGHLATVAGTATFTP